jgi:protein TonB
MIAKKNPKLQEEKNRVVYFQLGLLVTGTSLLMAFTWKTPVNSSEKLIVERASEIEVIQMMEEEKETPVEIPEVKKVEQQKALDPITIKMLTPFIDPTENKDKNEPVFVKTKAKDGDKVGDGDFVLDIGDAPKMEVATKFPDKEALFQGNWYQYLSDNAKYPEIAQEWGEEGTVFVGFIVEKNGSITDVKVKNKDRVAKSLQKEALRVVKSSPRWTPGIKDGEYVRSFKTVKVNFILERN